MSEFTLEQLDRWTTLATEGRQQLTTATEHEQQARNFEQKKLLKSALAEYESASKGYAATTKTLADVTTLTFDHAAIKELVAEAQRDYKQAQARSEAFVAERPDERCRQRMAQAQQSLQRAEEALRTGDNADAREAAQQAKELDPTLSEAADVVLRATETGDEGSGPPIGLIVGLVIIAGLVALGVIFGPELWTWISEFLFPAVLIH